MSRPVFILAALMVAAPAPAADPPPPPASVGDVIDAAHRATRPAALPLLNRAVEITPPSLRVGGLELQLRGIGGPFERVMQAALVAAGAIPGAGGGVVLVREAPLPPAPYVGAWTREKGGTRTTLTFTDRRLRVECDHAGKKVRLDADYAVGPDGVAFGVVTGAEPDDALVGELFKFRLRVDDGELTVRDPRLTADGFDAKATLVGRYKSGK
ncbi:MAG: hypothetical protein U0871_12840 [Gemmataceae bacterium]